MVTLLADAQTSAGSYFAAVFSTISAALLLWVTKLLWKLTTDLKALFAAMFPPNRESLPEQIATIRTDMTILRAVGTDKLQEVLEEAKVIRHHVDGESDREER